MRKEFSRAVKVARLRHATGADKIVRCEGCGVMMKPGQFAFDHDDPDGLMGEPTFDNCRVLCVSGEDSCHGRKTKLDQADIARAKRREAAALGAKPAPRQKIAQRGKPAKAPRDRLEMPPRRNLYVRIAP
jgi:hypothetical protein